MTQYERTALESIDRLRRQQEQELFELRQQFTYSPHKFNQSKKLTQYRAMEHKHFSTKNYDGATYFKYLADELEEFEKLTQQEKNMLKFQKNEE